VQCYWLLAIVSVLVADCLKSGKPSQLAGDIFFNFTCADCDASGTEKCERLKLLW